ncbi:SDR family oxidoreductase [Pontibacter sp. KCTC 32443]|uniref:SDR family oxidoreductase n=1 Tax=Pontibacter TaxID=323449 RepID=UPI00164DE18B|nr:MULTISPECIES: SDR family oxidoreductase [Pontibacter]MBC5773970.1 SDR family oxidoreductase [Pontibacter sp. KCTC 32443]
MQQTILVTGATGTVGREVVKQLSMLDGIRVRAGVHSLIKGENLRRLPDVEVVEMEFNDPESLHAAFTHADKVFLVTPLANEQVEMAKKLVDEAKRCGVKHIVKLSALGAGAEPGIQLGRWHREIERYIEESGIPYTFLRPASFMQNFENYNAATIKQEGKIYMPTGDGKVSYVDARDIAAVAVAVLTGEGHEGQIYDLTGPEAMSVDEVAETISYVTGNQVDFVNVPEDAARQAMQQQHVPDWMANSLLELYSVHRAGYSSGVTSRVEEITGRKPHTFRQFLQDYKECFV